MDFAHAQHLVDALAPWFSIAADTVAVGGAVGALFARFWPHDGSGPPRPPRHVAMLALALFPAGLAGLGDPALPPLVYVAFLLGEFAVAGVVDIWARQALAVPRQG